MMEKRGVHARLVSVPGGNPVVFGEIKTPGATRTLVFYAHYDGQPLDPKEWATPPFTPTLRDKQLEKDGRVIPLPAPGMKVSFKQNISPPSVLERLFGTNTAITVPPIQGSAGIR